MRKFLAYFVPIVLAFAVGALGSYVQGEALEEWYPYLVKSPATPPPVAFPIAWSVLYLLMGISAGTMLVRGDVSVMRIWLLQLLLNFLWSVLYLLMGISAGTMLVRGDVSVMRIWLLQLLLNFLWSVCFFALRSAFLGLVVILALDVTVFAYIIYSMWRRKAAAWLFLPYLLWLIFATYLNGYIYINN